MGLFGFSKKNEEVLSKEEQYGKAWQMIVGLKKKPQGLQIMQDLDKDGYSEATVVLGMFEENATRRKELVKKAADAGNIEGIWEYCGFLPHSYCPDPEDEADALWEKYCLTAAEGGSVDAMNEMGNVFNRRNHYVEAMYWYAMANAHGQADGAMSLYGTAKKWVMAGTSYTFEKGSPKFDEARHRCAIAYLEVNAGMDLSVSLDEVIKYVLDGVPIAAYFAGDVFEAQENYEMAYKMYNAIAFENDPHGIKCYADMLYTGRGVNKDPQNAFKYYQRAGELGERDAMFITGEFTRGSDKNKAAYWYGLAHTRGQGNALTRLTQLVE